ncbi:hypothetical protein MBLNU230_g4173t1 [Neophaeotheca triangularis]
MSAAATHTAVPAASHCPDEDPPTTQPAEQGGRPAATVDEEIKNENHGIRSHRAPPRRPARRDPHDHAQIHRHLPDLFAAGPCSPDSSAATSPTSPPTTDNPNTQAFDLALRHRTYSRAMHSHHTSTHPRAHHSRQNLPTLPAYAASMHAFTLHQLNTGGGDGNSPARSSNPNAQAFAQNQHLHSASSAQQVNRGSSQAKASATPKLSLPSHSESSSPHWRAQRAADLQAPLAGSSSLDVLGRMLGGEGPRAPLNSPSGEREGEVVWEGRRRSLTEPGRGLKSEVRDFAVGV